MAPPSPKGITLRQTGNEKTIRCGVRCSDGLIVSNGHRFIILLWAGESFGIGIDIVDAKLTAVAAFPPTCGYLSLPGWRHGIAGAHRRRAGLFSIRSFTLMHCARRPGPCLHGRGQREPQAQDECIHLVVGLFARLIVKNGYPFEVISPMHSLELIKALDLKPARPWSPAHFAGAREIGHGDG